MHLELLAPSLTQFFFALADIGIRPTTARFQNSQCNPISPLNDSSYFKGLGVCFISRNYADVKPLVLAVGLEPTRYCYQRILSPLRLPVPPRQRVSRKDLLRTNFARVF